jgi:kynureninase
MLEDAKARDESDELAGFAEEFLRDGSDLVYLNGNSLGQPSRRAVAWLEAALAQWREELGGAWSHWVDLPREIGDAIGTGLLGASPGETIMADSTSVNLYKLMAASIALDPRRRAIVIDEEDFPTDRYLAEGLATQLGCELRRVTSDLDQGLAATDLAPYLDEEVALVVLSHVHYRSGAILDLQTVAEAAHSAGALAMFDVSHSVGVVPIELGEADLAVGCTYKYLGAGPGAPSFLFVRDELIERLVQPIWGWFSARDQFAMGPRYVPRADIGRFLVGTPSVLALAPVAGAVELVAEAGIERIRAKSIALTELLVEGFEEELAPLGYALASPRDAARRGGHVTLAHPRAREIVAWLASERKVIVDYREPSRMRVAPSPLATRFADVVAGIEALRDAARLVG